jgi:hypothetical protein
MVIFHRLDAQVPVVRKGLFTLRFRIKESPPCRRVLIAQSLSGKRELLFLSFITTASDQDMYHVHCFHRLDEDKIIWFYKNVYRVRDRIHRHMVWKTMFLWCRIDDLVHPAPSPQYNIFYTERRKSKMEGREGIIAVCCVSGDKAWGKNQLRRQ